MLRTYLLAPFLNVGYQSQVIYVVLMRGRAEAARRAHNPEVVRSNRAPATEMEPEYSKLWFFHSPAYCG